MLDDSETDRYVTKRFLRHVTPDWIVEESDDPEMSVVRCLAEPPDCLVVDYYLGCTDGISVIERLNAGRQPGNSLCPTVLLTGSGTKAVVAAQAIKVGAHDYVVKENLTAAGLARSVRNAIETVSLRRELIHTAERLRTSFDNNPDCIAIYSVRRRTNGSIAFERDYANKLAEESRIGEQFAGDIVTGECRSDLQEMVDTGRPFQRTISVADPNKTAKHLQVSAWRMDDGFAVTWRDITAQHAMQEQLLETQMRLRLSVNSIGGGTYAIDLSNGERRYDARMRELMGIEETNETNLLDINKADDRNSLPFDVTEDTFWKLVIADDHDAIRQALEKAVASTAGLYHTEFRVRPPQHGDSKDDLEPLRWLASTGKIVRNAQGEPTQLIGLAYDITERKRLEAEVASQAVRDRRIAEALQRSLLSAPDVDELRGIQIGTAYRAALDEAFIGGDFYDAFAVDDERIALVVGDATGKGLQAAEQIGEAKYALRALLSQRQTAASALNSANKMYTQYAGSTLRKTKQLVDDSYMAVQLVVVNVKTGVCQVAIAGMEHVCVLGWQGAYVRHVGTTGPSLGVSSRFRYPHLAFTLAKGETIVMLTDGLYEARRGREFLDLSGVIDLVQHAVREHTSLNDAATAVIDGVVEYAEGRRNDDMCILLARYAA